MPFHFGRFSGLLLIFFVHGLVYTILLLQKGIRNRSAAERWLALVVFCAILYVCPWMLGFAGWYDGYDCMNCRNFLFYMPLQQTLLMGPAIYFYLLCLLQPGFKFQRRHWLHFVPFFLYMTWCLIVFVTDRLVLQEYYLMDGVQDPDFDSWYLIVGLISLVIYAVRSLRLYRHYTRYIVQQVSFADDLTFRWVRNFLIVYCFYCVSSLIFNVAQLAGANIDYVDSWWFYLLFSILFYYIAINGYSNSLQTRIGFQVSQLPLVEYVPDEPIPAVPRSAPELDPWADRLESTMARDHHYRNPELTLADLARVFDVSPAFMSKLINQGIGVNFNDYINRYRVREVQSRLEQGDGARLTLMSLAYDAGFNSKATFNRAFKKFTGKNPSDFGTIGAG